MREGDPEAFSILASKYSPVLWRIAHRIVRDFHLAQDLAQEALLRAFVKSARIHPDVPFIAWVARIVRNTAIDVVRRQRHLRQRALEDTIDERTLERSDDAHVPTVREVARLWDEVGALRESERRVLLLRYSRGLELRAIAHECGVSVESAKSRLHRARRRLSARLFARTRCGESPGRRQRDVAKNGCSR